MSTSEGFYTYLIGDIQPSLEPETTKSHQTGSDLPKKTRVANKSSYCAML